MAARPVLRPPYGNSRDRQIGQLRRGIDRLIDSYAEETIEADEFKPRLAGLKQRLARLQEDRDTAMAANEAECSLHLVIGRLADFAGRVRDGLDQLDWHGRRDIIRALVQRIEIDHDKVEVMFRIPGAPAPPDGGGIDRSDRSQSGHSPAIRQYCGTSRGGLVGKNAGDIGAALDLLVDALDRVGTGYASLGWRS